VLTASAGFQAVDDDYDSDDDDDKVTILWQGNHIVESTSTN
jgi:hypothetical protein